MGRAEGSCLAVALAPFYLPQHRAKQIVRGVLDLEVTEAPARGETVVG